MEIYTVNELILDTLISTEEKLVSKKLKALGLSYDKKTDEIEGLCDNSWVRFNLQDIMNDIEEYLNYYNDIDYNHVQIKDLKNNEVLDMTVSSAITFLNDSFTYVRNRIKGLSELDGNELAETSLKPDTRQAIQCVYHGTEEEKEMFKTLFGNSTELRKNFVINMLTTKEEN
jgi:DNA gyrase/topoisomerase IV subunit B